jgi:hypothetical protein
MCRSPSVNLSASGLEEKGYYFMAKQSRILQYSELSISGIFLSGIFALAGHFLGNLDLLPNSPPLAGFPTV